MTCPKPPCAARWKLGVTLFDTADIYGHGHSEALIGEVLQEWDGPQPTVVTKGGINFYRRDGTLEPDWTPYALAHAVQQSLARLRRETLDVFLLMNPPVQELDRWRVWETLDALRRAGKIKHIGVSVADPQDGVWLLQNNLPVDVLEVAYSLFYQGASVELLPLARKRKVGILAREPLANGFLTGKYAADAQFPGGDIRAALPPEYVAAMAEMAEKLSFLTRDGARTMTQAALRFVLDDPAVSSRRRGREDAGAGDGKPRGGRSSRPSMPPSGNGSQRRFEQLRGHETPGYEEQMSFGQKSGLLIFCAKHRLPFPAGGFIAPEKVPL